MDDDCEKPKIDYQKLIESKFGWKFEDTWTTSQLRTIYSSGQKILTYSNTVTNGNGSAWMSTYLGNAVFHHGNMANEILNTNWVNPDHQVYLLDGLSEHNIVHELGHVIDNMYPSESYLTS